MPRKLITLLAAAIMAASLTVSAFAAAPVTGKVTKVEGDRRDRRRGSGLGQEGRRRQRGRRLADRCFGTGE